MQTSSNFFKKTFFSIQPEEENQGNKQYSPWQLNKFPKFSTIDNKQKNRINRPYSLLQQYDPSYIDTRRKVQHLRRRHKREFKIQQFSAVLNIKPKQKCNLLSYQALNIQPDQISLPQLRMKMNPFGQKNSDPMSKGGKNTLNELEQMLRALKNPYDNDLNFIRKSQKKKQTQHKDIKKNLSRNQKQGNQKQSNARVIANDHFSFDIYEKCIKSNRSVIHPRRDLQADLFKAKSSSLRPTKDYFFKTRIF